MIITAKKVYGQKVALDVSCLKFEQGKIYALIGANGSGKSTLLKCLANIVDFDGEIKEPIKDMAYMPQHSYAFSISVKNNILLAFPFKERKKHLESVDKIMEKLELGKLKNKNASRLSGGETQKTALARLMVKKHCALLLDEPTSAMDIKAALKVENELINYAKEHNTTVIFATHSLRQASLAHEVIFLKDGYVVEREQSANILKSPKKAETKEFIDFF
ncbi:MAG: ABC transporter ATP-binding protein [Clostridiales bacterium]|nr:ABC transporter ATP-binding protein [Clostridiales bacterium]